MARCCGVSFSLAVMNLVRVKLEDVFGELAAFLPTSILQAGFILVFPLRRQRLREQAWLIQEYRCFIDRYFFKKYNASISFLTNSARLMPWRICSLSVKSALDINAL